MMSFETFHLFQVVQILLTTRLISSFWLSQQFPTNLFRRMNYLHVSLHWCILRWDPLNFPIRAHPLARTAAYIHFCWLPDTNTGRVRGLRWVLGFQFAHQHCWILSPTWLHLKVNPVLTFINIIVTEFISTSRLINYKNLTHLFFFSSHTCLKTT